MADEEKDIVAEEQPEAVGGDVTTSADEAVTTDAAVQPAAVKPALKLAENEESSSEDEKLIGTQSADTEPAPVEVPVQAAPAPSTRKQLPRKFGLMTVNRCLAVVVIVIVFLAGFEVWSNARTIQVPEAPPAILMPESDDSDIVLPPIEALLKSFEARPILGNPDEMVTTTTTTTTKQGRKPKGVMVKYAQENLDLIGMSDGEAIIVDKKVGKMFFLKVGGEIPVNDQRLRLEQIGADQVQFTDGSDTVTVK